MSFRSRIILGLFFLLFIVILESFISYTVNLKTSSTLKDVIISDEAKLSYWRDISDMAGAIKDELYLHKEGKVKLISRADLLITELLRKLKELENLSYTTHELQIIHDIEKATGKLQDTLKNKELKNSNTKHNEEFSYNKARQIADLTTIWSLYITNDIKEKNKRILSTSKWLKYILLLIPFFATVAAISFAIIIMKALLEPLKKLVFATEILASGNLSHRIDVLTSDEFGELAASFNEMAEELRRSRNELIKEKIYIESIVNSIINMLFVLNMDGTVRFINKAALKMLGYKESELYGKDIRNLFTSKNDINNVLQKIMTKGYIESKEVSLKCSNGKEIWAIVSASCIRTQNGTPTGIVLIAQDITELKKVQTRLSEEKERLRITLYSIGDAVIITDATGRITMMNLIAENLTGWTQEDAKGKKIDEIYMILNEKTRKPYINPVLEALTTGSIVRLSENIVLISRDGIERIISDNVSPIKDKDGQIIGAILVFRDITEQHKFRNELIKIQKLESLGIMAGGIAHDFNNLLTGILGNIDISKTMVSKDSNIYKRLTNAEKVCLRAKDLAQELLIFSKGGTPIKELINIEEVIKTSIDIALKGTAVEAEVSVVNDLWLVEADPGQLNQVLMNLILNASQAMNSKGTVKIHAKNLILEKENSPGPIRPGKYVIIEVTDQGEGIAPENLSKIFDPFFTTKKQGSGLGLTIAYSIVKKHDGYITVDSSPGQGSTFKVYLPAVDKTSYIAKQNNDIELDLPEGTSVLLMDDEEMLRDVASEILSSLGCNVTAVSSGEEAIKVFKESQNKGKGFDIVILDLTVKGGMGGKEAIKKLLNIAPDIRAAVTSGYFDDPVLSEYKRYGFKAALIKPYNIRNIKKMLYELYNDIH